MNNGPLRRKLFDWLNQPLSMPDPDLKEAGLVEWKESYAFAKDWRWHLTTAGRKTLEESK